MAVAVEVTAPGAGTPWLAVALVAVVLAADLVALWDLRRRPARHLPKPAWAALILLSFPLGLLAWVFAGRVPRGEEPLAAPPPPAGPPLAPAASPDTATTVRLDDVAGTVPPAGADVVLATRGLTRRYGEVTAVDAVDLAVPRGSVYGLIGPNGAGKTTLLSMVAGLRRPSSGAIDCAVPRERVAVLADTPLFEPWLTATEVVDLARHLVAPDAPQAQVVDALAEVGLVDVAERRVGGFSRGMLQRLGLATCLVGDPELLVLDEPSSALDPAGRREVLDLIGRLAGTRTVVLSTHVLVDVQQVCDTVGVLRRGHLAFQGPIGELLARTSSLYRLRVAPPDDALVAALTATPWVAEVTRDAPGSLRVRVADVAAAEAGIARVVADSGARLHHFAPAADLETAFLALTAGAP